MRATRSPTRLANARDLPAQRHLAEADAAEAELPVHGPRAPAALAAVAMPDLELRLPLRPLDQSLACHRGSLIQSEMIAQAQAACTCTGVSPRNGIPRARSSAIPSSSRSAVVTKVMSIPWIFCTLS